MTLTRERADRLSKALNSALDVATVVESSGSTTVIYLGACYFPTNHLPHNDRFRGLFIRALAVYQSDFDLSFRNDEGWFLDTLDGSAPRSSKDLLDLLAEELIRVGGEG